MTVAIPLHGFGEGRLAGLDFARMHIRINFCKILDFLELKIKLLYF